MFSKIFFIATLACFGLLGGGYFIEYVYHIEPCPLCILQRLVFGIIAILFLVGALHNPKGIATYIYSILIMLMSITGSLLAARQIWLQHLPPDQVPSCTAGLNRLLEVYPVLEALKLIFNSSGECSVIDFTILGLSLAEWSLFSFVLLIGFSITLIFLIKKRRI